MFYKLDDCPKCSKDFNTQKEYDFQYHNKCGWRSKFAEQLEGATPDKPLFIALMTEYYIKFEDGSKDKELRLYGPRWNEKTCYIGRRVTLSKGYGKKNRLTGVVTAFKKQKGYELEDCHQKAILKLYGTLEKDIAIIYIKVEK